MHTYVSITFLGAYVLSNYMLLHLVSGSGYLSVMSIDFGVFRLTLGPAACSQNYNQALALA